MPSRRAPAGPHCALSISAGLGRSWPPLSLLGPLSLQALLLGEHRTHACERNALPREPHVYPNWVLVDQPLGLAPGAAQDGAHRAQRALEGFCMRRQGMLQESANSGAPS